MKNTASYTTLAQIFGSRLRARVLGWFFSHPDERFFVRQLATLLQEDSTNLSRELVQLERLGILRAAREGPLKFYRADPDCPIYSELRSLVRKTIGTGDLLRAGLEPLADRIELAFVFGSVAEGREVSGSDVDLLVVGRVGLGEIVAALGGVQETLGREVNPMVYTPEEARDKLAAGSHFLSRVLAGPKMIVLGDPRELDRLAQIRMVG